MKRLSLFLLLFLALGLNAAKVALIPTAPELEPVTDQVLAVMSNDSGIEFLERASIKVILKERNLTAAGLTGSNLIDLSKTIHADLFAVITAKPALKGKKDTAVSGLIVYDARNGFRLVNTALSEQDAVKEIVERLRQAQDIIKHPEKQILLSIVTVRDAGVPERFKYPEAFIAADLERRLSDIPNAIVLERDYLDSVNQERKLTGQMFALAPSARLLRLEFSPGSSPEIVNLTLRVTDVAGKELFRFAFDNCFAEPDNSTVKTSSAMTEYLHASTPGTTVSASDEAARFFAEYRVLIGFEDYAVAHRKLDSAIALDPSNIKYRLAKLEMREEKPETSQKAIARLQQVIAWCQEIKRDFPTYQKLLYFHCVSYIERNHLTFLQADQNGLAELVAIIEEIRPKYEEEFCRVKKINLNGEFETFDQWRTYSFFCWHKTEFYRYFDLKRWGINYCRTRLEHLQRTEDFFRLHPEWISQVRSDENGTRGQLILRTAYEALYRNPLLGDKKYLDDLILDSSEYIKLGLCSPVPSERINVLQLDLLRKTIAGNYEENAFKDNVLEYYRQAAAVDAKLFEKKSSTAIAHSDVSGIEIWLDEHRELRGIARTIKRDFIANELKTSPNEKLFATINAITDPTEKAKKVLELAPTLQQYKSRVFTDPDIQPYFYHLGKELSRKADKLQICRDALAVLFNDIEIETLASVDDLDLSTKKPERICIANAISRDDGIYLLLSKQQSVYSSGKRNIFRHNCIGKLDFKSTKIQILTAWISITQPSSGGGDCHPMAIDEKIAAVANNGEINIYSLASKNSFNIKDLPAPEVMAIAILNNRIYAFLGDESESNKNRTVTILFSCKFDGSDRQIHISTLREDKKNILDRLPPFKVRTMFADKYKNRLIFDRDDKNGIENGLWEFAPDSGIDKPLLKVKRGIYSCMTQVNNTVFLFSFFENRTWYAYDLTTDQTKIILSSKKKSVDGGPVLLYAHPPFFCSQGRLWAADTGNAITLLTLPDVTKSSMIFMPDWRNGDSSERHLIFPHPDGKSAIAIDYYNIYKLTPKETLWK